MMVTVMVLVIQSGRSKYLMSLSLWRCRWRVVFVLFNEQLLMLVQSLKVHLEVTFGRESIATNVASIRSFARVRANVNLNGRVAAEHFAAQMATMLVGRGREHAHVVAVARRQVDHRVGVAVGVILFEGRRRG